MQTVLITGATSGIGKASAQLFLSKNFRVIATGRNLKNLQELEEIGAKTFVLDVNKSADINNLITHIVDNSLTIDILVNNAGYGQFGTIEETSDELARKQFDTNVFGLAAITRAILPLMRAQQSGRIINVSSIAGKTSMPGGGWYAASKFAVEALSDSLRWETNKFGIKVSLIEPGPIKTEFASTVGKTVVIDENGPYKSLIKNLTGSTDTIKGGTVEHCAKAIYHAATSKRPKIRYLVTKEAKLISFLVKWIPARLVDKLIIKMFIKD
jgi:short-subunit dehydrogenase